MAEDRQRSDLGPAVERPELFYGLYATAEAPDRQWFVNEARTPIWAERAPQIPPGHLQLGAMFGDVAPWPLRTLSATRFEQAQTADGQPERVSIEFQLDGSGRAVSFTFTGGMTAIERLDRVGDLPEDWR